MVRWLVSILRSFGPALTGVGWALNTQRNLQFHALATLVVFALGIALKIVIWEWCVIVLSIGFVWTAELLNTALEVLADRVSREREEPIRLAKDAAAAAVLLAALAALIVGCLIFLPKIRDLFENVVPLP